MCGRYAVFLPAEAFAKLFHTVNPLVNVAPSWNIAPTQNAMVVRPHPETGERQREGIAKARQEGKYKGRVPTARRKAAEIIRLKSEGVRPTEIAGRLGIGRASVYRVLGQQNGGERQEAA